MKTTPKKPPKTKAKTSTKSKVDQAMVNRIFKVAPRIISRVSKESEQVLIMDLNKLDLFYSLDSWAAQSWLLIDGKTSTSSIVSKIKKRSGLKEEVVQKEVTALIEKLLDAGLISDHA